MTDLLNRLLDSAADRYGSIGCQWIEGDPRAGAPKCDGGRLVGRPYCLAHHARAYLPRGFQAVAENAVAENARAV